MVGELFGRVVRRAGWTTDYLGGLSCLRYCVVGCMQTYATALYLLTRCFFLFTSLDDIQTCCLFFLLQKKIFALQVKCMILLYVFFF
jgi:hypothetical protein